MTLRVLGVGAGYFSQFHYESWRRLADVTLAGACDLDLSRAEAMGAEQAFADLDAALAAVKPDLVDLITPPASRLALAGRVAAYGLPMILQKPLADDLAGAEAIAALAERTGVPMLVHENFRFQPWYRETKRLLDAGLLGDPQAILFRMRPGDGRGLEAYLGRQPYFRQMPRFLIHETAIHYVDTFRYLLGEVDAVFADLRRLNPVIAGEDAGVVLFRFRDGARGTFDGNRLSEFEAGNPRLTMGEMWLDCADARLRLTGDGRLWLKPNGQSEREHVYHWQDRGFGGDCVHGFQTHAVQHFTAGALPETRVQDYLTNIRIEEAIYQANDEGRWITV